MINPKPKLRILIVYSFMFAKHLLVVIADRMFNIQVYIYIYLYLYRYKSIYVSFINKEKIHICFDATVEKTCVSPPDNGKQPRSQYQYSQTPLNLLYSSEMLSFRFVGI